MRRSGRETEFASRGTEGIRGLGDSCEAISLASYFLTADRGIVSWWQSTNRNFMHNLGHLWAQRWYLKCKEIRRRGKVFPRDDCWSQIPRDRMCHMKMNLDFYLWDPWLVMRALIHSDTSVHGQMMSLWWHAPNGDHLSKLECEGQRHVNFPLYGYNMG